MKKFIIPFVWLLAFVSITSCKDDDNNDSQVKPGSNEYINEWISEVMKTVYLWNDKLPEKTDMSLSPEKYFESLLYSAEDRFSSIMENYVEMQELIVGVDTEAGYDFALFYYDISQNPRTVCGMVNYIKPNSPASNTELKRGQIFTHINGLEINEDNFSTLLAQTYSAHTLTVLDIETYEVKEIALSVTKYQEPPILLDTVYNINSHKIGYLVYNFFADDAGDNSLKYVKALNDVFGKFKSAGIDDLILDLRYNPGGALQTASSLSSMISGKSTGDVFLLLQFNSLLEEYYQQTEGENYNKSYFYDNIYDAKGVAVAKINKLGLSRLNVIVSDRTASASESVINGLMPYLNSVVLVGDTTVGKNVGMIAIYEDDEEKQQYNKWGLLPIVVKIANANGYSDYGKGFAPDVKVSEYDAIDTQNNLTLKQLGDTDELLLHTTLVNMGVLPKSSVKLSPANSNRPEIKTLRSSIDRRPVRVNAYINKKFKQQ